MAQPSLNRRIPRIPRFGAGNPRPLGGVLRRGGASRRGLAPLELVIWLPVLLMTAALIMNFGVLATWRVRGEVAARDAAWRVRWPRTGNNQPRPPAGIWPESARFEVRNAGPLTQLDVPEIDHPVVRGPLENGFVVNPILDPSPTLIEGVTEIERPFPMLPRLGPFRSGEIRHLLLDYRWSAAEMGLGANVIRRIPALYKLPQTNQRLPQAFVDAVEKANSIPSIAGLDVLDHDEDVLRYTGSYRDFHPYVGRGCDLDREEVYERHVKRIVDHYNDDREVELGQISRLPSTLTNFFLSMYRQAIARLEAQIDALEQEKIDARNQLRDLPKQQQQYQQQISQLQGQLGSASQDQASAIQSQIAGYQQQIAAIPQLQSYYENRIAEIPGEIAAAEAEIAEIKKKVEQLEKYAKRLGQIEAKLKAAAAKYLAEKGR